MIHPQIRDKIAVSRDVELSLLKTLIADAQRFAFAASWGLTPDHFNHGDIRYLYEIGQSLFSRRGSVDEVSILAEVLERGETDKANPALHALDSAQVDRFSFDGYLGRVLASRRLAAFCGSLREAEESVFGKGMSLLEREEAMEVAIGKVLRHSSDSERQFLDAKQFAIHVADSFRAAEEGRRAQKQKTGIMSLDTYIGGFVPGRVAIIGGRPSHGKTAFATHLAVQQNRKWRQMKEDGQVLYFSSEMSHEEMGDRISSTLSGVSADRIGAGACNEREREKVKKALNEMVTDIRIAVDTNPRPTTAHMMSRAVAANAIHPVRHVIFDYLEYTGEKGESKDLRLESALQGCHEIAKRLDCPVTVLSQLSRGLDRRGAGSRPQLSDIRYTGAGEQIAALVIMVYHEVTHLQQMGDAGSSDPFSSSYVDENDYELLIRKNTHGPIGDIKLRFYPETGTFIDPMAESALNGGAVQ